LFGLDPVWRINPTAIAPRHSDRGVMEWQLLRDAVHELSQPKEWHSRKRRPKPCFYTQKRHAEDGHVYSLVVD
jgi:hypothetical protein